MGFNPFDVAFQAGCRREAEKMAARPVLFHVGMWKGVVQAEEMPEAREERDLILRGSACLLVAGPVVYAWLGERCEGGAESDRDVACLLVEYLRPYTDRANREIYRIGHWSSEYAAIGLPASDEVDDKFWELVGRRENGYSRENGAATAREAARRRAVRQSWREEARSP